MNKLALLLTLFVVTSASITADVGCSGTKCTANSEGVLAEYKNYRFHVSSLLESGTNCVVNSALLNVWKTDNIVDRKKIEKGRTILVSDPKAEDIGIKFIKGYSMEATDYVEFEILPADQADKQPGNQLTIHSEGFTRTEQGYKYKIDSFTYGTGCEIKSLTLQVSDPGDMITIHSIPLNLNITVGGYVIKFIDGYSSKGINQAVLQITEAPTTSTTLLSASTTLLATITTSTSASTTSIPTTTTSETTTSITTTITSTSATTTSTLTSTTSITSTSPTSTTNQSSVSQEDTGTNTAELVTTVAIILIVALGLYTIARKYT